MSTLTLPLRRAIRRSSLRIGSDVEVAGGGLETGGVAPSVDLSDKRLCQRRNIRRSWQDKSINEKIVILPPTSVDLVLRKRSILKKSDISRNQVPTKTRTITPIPLLYSRLTKEDSIQ